MALQQREIREIVEWAVSKKVDIPEFQREFVWSPEQVKLLAESLYREYPVGSFLVWDCSEYEEAKTSEGSQAPLWVVDGQQRTTAFCLLLGMKPYWWPDYQDWNESLDRYDVLVNIFPEKDDGRLEFGLPNPIRRQDPRWFPIRRVLSTSEVEALTPISQDIAKNTSASPDEALDLFGRVHGHLQRLWQIRTQDIPIMQIAHEVEDVAEIFARLNREGTRVKEADVVLALAAVRNPGWVREEYLPYRTGLEERGWDLDPGVFIRAMTGLGVGRARLKEVQAKFWQPANLKAVWSTTRTAVTEVVKRLADFGIVSGELLPSMNSLIPLFVLHGRWKDGTGYSFDRALRWFLLANRDFRYSGSAITRLNEDVGAIYRAESFGEALDKLMGRLQVSPITSDDFLGRYDRASSLFQRLMLYLVLFHSQGTDWVDGTRIGYDKTGSPVTTGYQPQWHHIYPRSLLRDAGEKDDTVHALANITVLNERTNVSKLMGKAPAKYIKQYDISAEALTAHCVPAPFAQAGSDDAVLKQQWSLSMFTDFCLERAQLLADNSNHVLAKLSGA